MQHAREVLSSPACMYNHDASAFYIALVLLHEYFTQKDKHRRRSFELRSLCRQEPAAAVSIRWTGLGTGLWDWTKELDSRKVALKAAHTLLHVHHELNSGQTAITRYDEVLAAISADLRAIQMVPHASQISTGHYLTAIL